MSSQALSKNPSSPSSGGSSPKRPRTANVNTNNTTIDASNDNKNTNINNHSDKDGDDYWRKPLKVMYQDDDMAIIVKPQGMPVHGCRPCLMKSDLLLALRSTKPKPKHKTTKREAKTAETSTVSSNPLGKPRLVHRLDAATGGLLVVAKTYEAERQLKQSFATKTDCHKRYQAIVIGKLEVTDDSKHDGFGICEAAISGKPSVTRYKPLRQVQSRSFGWLTLVDLELLTGRNHQLRRHMQHLGHPILGDKRYSLAGVKNHSTDTLPIANRATYKFGNHPMEKKLCLWSVGIKLPHPMTKEEISCELSEPEWFQFVMQHEEEEWKAWKERQQQENSSE